MVHTTNRSCDTPLFMISVNREFWNADKFDRCLPALKQSTLNVAVTIPEDFPVHRMLKEVMKPSGLRQSHPVGRIISAGVGLLGARLTWNKHVFFPQMQQNRFHRDQLDYITSTPLYNDHDITMKLLTNGSGGVQHTTAAPLCFDSFVLSISLMSSSQCKLHNRLTHK